MTHYPPKNLKTQFLSITLLLSILLLTFSFKLDDSDPKSFNLQTNASDINIITPENKTYYKPMNGYYLSSFGFENEVDGTIGAQCVGVRRCIVTGRQVRGDRWRSTSSAVGRHVGKSAP